MDFRKENLMINLKEPISADEVEGNVTSWNTLGFRENLTKAIALFASNAGLHCVFIVDPYNRLLGVITRHDLLNWIRRKLESFSYYSLSDADKFIRLRNLINSSKVQEVMNPNGCLAAINPNVTLLHALNLMTEFELTVLPVVDGSNRVIGARTLSDVLHPITT